ncbi:hypothetical protein CPB85DRAFT_650225 [Mucidula mucida]|nr:hypothetical protein CPB85DRAFT_650225 [Mucidula mucida]
MATPSKPPSKAKINKPPDISLDNDLVRKPVSRGRQNESKASKVTSNFRPPAFSDSVFSSGKPTSSSKPKPMAPPIFPATPIPAKFGEPSTPSKPPSSSKPKSRGPPIFLPTTPAQPRHPAPFPLDLSTQSTDTRPPPVLVAPTATPTKLKAVPVPRVTPHTPPKRLRTISTTRVALATDLSTEAGSSEVASVFLRNQYANHTQDHEQTRGLEQSPQKSGSKYIRNGFGSTAATVLSQSRTSLVLWESELRNLSLSKMKPEIRFQIAEITHIPSPSSSPSTPGIALCHNLMFDSHRFPLSSSPPKLVTLLLSFASHPNPLTTPVRNPTLFAVGCQVWVWKPFQVVAGEMYVCERFVLQQPSS